MSNVLNRTRASRRARTPRPLGRAAVVAAVVAVATVAPLTIADTSDEARAVLAKLSDATHSNYRASTVMQMNMTAEGQSVTMDGAGSIVQRGETHALQSLDMSMNAGPMGTMNVKMSAVRNGDTVWIDVESPMMGGRQVTRASIATFDKMTAQASGPGDGLSSLDPMRQAEAFAELYDLVVASKDGDVVSLSGTLADASAFATLPPEIQGQLESITMTVDTSTGFLQALVIGAAEKPVIKFALENVEIVEADALGDDLFAYEPPEGVEVIDADAAFGGVAAEGSEP